MEFGLTHNFSFYCKIQKLVSAQKQLISQEKGLHPKKRPTVFFYVFITSSSNKILQVPFVQERSTLRCLKRKRISDNVALLLIVLRVGATSGRVRPARPCTGPRGRQSSYSQWRDENTREKAYLIRPLFDCEPARCCSRPRPIHVIKLP